MPRTKVWIISLADADARRAQIAAALKDSALDWDFFNAHRTLQNGLYYRALDSHASHGRTLRRAELGCYSSHYATWQWLADSEYEQMFVFEDDVSVDWEFIAQLAEVDFAAMQIDYLRLFAKIPPRWRYVASPFFDRYHHLIRCTGFTLGTQAYLLTRAGAAALLKHGQRIRYPIDAFLDSYWEHGVPNLALFPFPVFERCEPSTIGAGRFAPERTSVQARAQFQYQRWALKLRMLREHFGPDSAAVRALKANLHGRFSEAPQAVGDAP